MGLKGRVRFARKPISILGKLRVENVKNKGTDAVSLINNRVLRWT